MSQALIDNATDIGQFMEDMNAGTFAQQIGIALSDVAIGVTTTSKRAGRVVIEFDIKRIGESNQVNIKHKLKMKRPTMKGVRTEELEGETPMHVGRGGKMSLFPEAQTDLFKTAQQAKPVTA